MLSASAISTSLSLAVGHCRQSSQSQPNRLASERCVYLRPVVSSKSLPPQTRIAPGSGPAQQGRRSSMPFQLVRRQQEVPLEGFGYVGEGDQVVLQNESIPAGEEVERIVEAMLCPRQANHRCRAAIKVHRRQQ